MQHPKPKRYESARGVVTWRVRFRHEGRDTSETFGTEAAARIFCSDVASRDTHYALAMRDAEDRDQRRGMTLDEAFAKYLDWKATGAKKVRSDRTIKDYRRRYELAIKPMLGDRPLASIADTDVAEWVDALSAGTTGAKVRMVDGRRTEVAISPKSIADRHALLHAVMKFALARKLIDVDPCAMTTLPTRRKGQPRGLRPAEWQALHAALAQIDPDAADLAAFMLASGWRWGEATALSTYDVEDDGERMWVTMTQVMRRDATGRAHVVPDAKSDAGFRRVEIDPEAASMVRRRIRLARPGALVFTTKNGAPWHHSHFRSRAWEPAVKVANLNRHPTPHWLRHTHVGWMLMTGEAATPELSARVGHASIRTTVDVYGRMVSDVRPSALTAFAAMRGTQPAVAAQPEPLVIQQ